MGQGLLVLLGVLVAATAFGVRRRRTEGRLRPTAPATSSDGAAAEAVLPTGELDAALGERATLVQFSSAFCQPCRAARTLLADVSRSQPGVVHLEVDAESHLDLVRRLGIRRTPTTLVLDAAGRELGRAVGVPRRAAVLAALAEIA